MPHHINRDFQEMCRQMSILFKREREKNILQQNSGFVLNKKI